MFEVSLWVVSPLRGMGDGYGYGHSGLIGTYFAKKTYFEMVCSGWD